MSGDFVPCGRKAMGARDHLLEAALAFARAELQIREAKRKRCTEAVHGEPEVGDPGTPPCRFVSTDVAS